MAEEVGLPDRYPNLKRVATRVFNEDDFPKGDVERIEITGVASGEATYRVWEARAEEPFSGTYTEEDLG